MKKQLSLTFGALLALSPMASAEALGGLNAIGHGSDNDFDTRLPFTTTIGMDVGWDSNPNNRPDGAEEDSAYIRGGFNSAYAGGSRKTSYSLNAGFSTIYYFDQAALDDSDRDDTFYSARGGFNVTHRANRRLTLGDSVYFSYEIEPDNVVGASATRRLGQYTYGYNNLWASYAWNRRVSTVTRYTISGIDYEDSTEGFAEDRLTHTFSQEVRYVLNRLTTLAGEGRYSFTDYDTGMRDYDSVYLLAGLDHSFSSDLRGTVRVGAEHRDYDRGDDHWRPYAETSLRYRVGKHTNLAWVNRLGYEDSELGASSFDTRYSYRSSLSIREQFSERLRGDAGVSYVHNEFEGGGRADLTEDLISLRLGLGYRIFSNVDLNAGYSFTFLNSDDALREYDRHRLSMGLGFTF